MVVLRQQYKSYKGKKIRISINISYEDIINSETLDYIYKSLQNNPGEAKLIDFEILESELIDDYEAVKNLYIISKNLVADMG